MNHDYLVASRVPASVWVSPHFITTRIDAEPFRPTILEVDELLGSRSDCAVLGTKLLRRRGLSGGATPLGANYLSDGIRFIRTENVTPNWIDLSDVVYISAEDHHKLQRSALDENDVLLTITGALFGQSATVYPECVPANISQHSVRLHFNDDINPRYVSTYLNCQYGQSQIQKHKVGATRSAIDYDGVKLLKLPLPLRPIQDYIGEKVHLAERCRLKAKNLRNNAQNCLSKAVGIDPNITSIEMSGKHFRALSVRPEAETVDSTLVSSRLDAAAYSPLRLALLEKFGEARCRFTAIDTVADDVTKSRKRHSRSSYSANYFVSILHLNDKGVVDLHAAKSHDPISLGIVSEPDDVLFSGINPSQNRIAVWTRRERTLCSAEFSVYRAKNGFSPFYLAFVWRSAYCLNQLDALTRGTSSSRRRLQDEDFSELQVPVVEPDLQKLIAHNEQRAVVLDTLAADFVRQAKDDVEALIEGRLDVDGIMAGRLKPPTWGDIEV